MNIAVVSIRFDSRGGSERRTYQLAKGLIAAGHKVEVFAASVEDMDLDAGVNLVPMPAGPSFIKVSGFTRNVEAMLASRRDIDVVHNQIRPFTDGVVTVGGGCHAEYLERSGKTFAFLNPLHHVILGLEKKRYTPGGCRAIITNSELARSGILRHYDYPEDRVFVAYNGVDLDKFSPANAEAVRTDVRARLGLGDGLVALFVGTGFARKGLLTVIRAMGVLKGSSGPASGMRLLVLGSDNPAPYVRAARKAGVAERIAFAGSVAKPEDYYGAADMFVLPTLFDPFSNASLEAMASGLPVVTTFQNGVREIISDGLSGFLMDRPDDHAGLAEIMLKLSEQDIRKRTGLAARKAAENMTWDNTTHKTIEVYGKVY